jgi:FkbM family methyltransferase
MPLWAHAKRLVHAALARAGYRLMPLAMASPDASMQALLREHAIDLILDVGANAGQFASYTFGLGYSGRIVSFEPLPAPHAALLASSRGNPRWEIAERCCLGEREGEALMHVSENSISSSILPILGGHVAISPEAGYVGVEKVPMHTLDAVAPRYLADSRAPFLKIDVQGYEEPVLRGASETLRRVRGLQVELSLCPVYEGQTLFLPLLEWIMGQGFAPYRFTPSFTDPRTGRWLQADGLFFRDVRAG